MHRITGSPRARALGAELRDARKAAALSQRGLAQRLAWPQTTITRAETGERPLSTDDVAALLAVLFVTGEHRDQLLALARNVDQSPWLVTGIGGLQPQLSALIEFERDAISIEDVAIVLVPGLLQTRDYASIVMRLAGMPSSEIEARVTLRIGRQAVLAQKNPVKYAAFIDELVLQRVLGDPTVMAEQLLHIADISRRPNVTVRLIPSGSNPAIDGSFVRLQFKKARALVHLEHRRSSLFVDDPADVADYASVADALNSSALDSEDSEALIRGRAKELGAEEKGE